MTAIGRGVPEPEAIRQDAESDAAPPVLDRLANRKRERIERSEVIQQGPSVARERDYPLPDRN